MYCYFPHKNALCASDLWDIKKRSEKYAAQRYTAIVHWSCLDVVYLRQIHSQHTVVTYILTRDGSALSLWLALIEYSHTKNKDHNNCRTQSPRHKIACSQIAMHFLPDRICCCCCSCLAIASFVASYLVSQKRVKLHSVVWVCLSLSLYIFAITFFPMNSANHTQTCCATKREIRARLYRGKITVTK